MGLTIHEAEINGKKLFHFTFFPKYFKANNERYVFPVY